MTGCQCVTCLHARARADRAPGRRNLRPLISPTAAARDAAAGGSTSGALTAESATEPSPVLGSRSAPDTLPRHRASGVPGLPSSVAAADGEPRLQGAS